MNKKILLLVLVFSFVFLSKQSFALSSTLPKADAYKAVVKINSFILDENFELDGFGHGSGVIINPSGLILTNYHVVTAKDSFDNTLLETTYEICLTNVVGEEAQCNYTARLVARDKELDIALLQIQTNNTKGTLKTFPYLNLKQSDTTNIGDEVTALGYPQIGGKSITLTKGIISGKNDKYNKKWIKTDAVISFGSSGGAALDSSGEVIGITSAGHSDFVGSLGYIINITSVNGWIDKEKNNKPQESKIENKIIEMILKIQEATLFDLITNEEPFYFISKPDDWFLGHESEKDMYLYKPGDDAGGEFSIKAIPLPYIATLDDIIPTVKHIMFKVNQISKIDVKDKNIDINGYKGKEITITLNGEQQKFYMIPVQNYLIQIILDYGEDDKDKKIVDDILKTLLIGDNKPFLETKKYANTNPKFYISTADNSDWSIIIHNSKESPIEIFNKKNKNIRVNIDIAKTEEGTTGKTNDSYVEYLKQSAQKSNQMGQVFDMKVETVNINGHYKLNNELANVITDEFAIKTASTGNLTGRTKRYTIISDDKLIQISLTTYNEKDFNNILKSFNQLASSFSLKNFTNPKNNSTDLSSISTKNNKLNGKILLQVESKGEAWYVSPNDQKRHSMGRPNDAFSLMRNLGIGISNNDLAKIKIANENFTDQDTDGDGLSDIIEDSIGTNKNKKDSDSDNYQDKDEIIEGYNPKGTGKIILDNNFAKKQSGKILLQVENNGEAWYVNPENNQRIFLGRPTDAFNLMRKIGLGISNNDLNKIDSAENTLVETVFVQQKNTNKEDGLSYKTAVNINETNEKITSRWPGYWIRRNSCKNNNGYDHLVHNTTGQIKDKHYYDIYNVNCNDKKNINYYFNTDSYYGKKK
jgi:hypothetical protein